MALVAFAVVGWGATKLRGSSESAPPETASEVAAAVQQAGGPPADVVNAAPVLPLKVDSHAIRRNESLYDALVAMSFTPEQVFSLVKAAKPHTNLSNVRVGTAFSLWRRNGGMDDGKLLSFQMPIAENKTLLARPSAQGGFEVDIREIPYETRQVGYTGTVELTLWDAAVKAGMDPNLIAELADVFAFSVDFNTEVRQGDRFRLVVEQKLLEGKPAGYGRVLAAEYLNRGDSHTAILFSHANGETDYYQGDGDSTRRLFLRSPLRYRRISSRFSSGRLHPVLKTRRAHQGVDYAADRGTPIRTVGDGVVTAANWNGGSGNFVKIRHNGTYETSYSHLSGYGPGVKKGTRVRQGQVIGYVGTTGLSTGPHLHFAFYESGRYVDPLSKKFPAADPVPASEKTAFLEQRSKLLPLLPAWPDEKTADSAGKMPVQPAMVVPGVRAASK